MREQFTTKSQRENLREILKDFAQRGIEYWLSRGKFHVDEDSPALTDDIRFYIEICNGSLSEYLCRQEGKCLDCGLTRAVRPRQESLFCEKCYWERVGKINLKPVSAEKKPRKSAGLQNLDFKENLEEEPG